MSEGSWCFNCSHIFYRNVSYILEFCLECLVEQWTKKQKTINASLFLLLSLYNRLTIQFKPFRALAWSRDLDVSRAAILKCYLLNPKERAANLTTSNSLLYLETIWYDHSLVFFPRQPYFDTFFLFFNFVAFFLNFTMHCWMEKKKSV